jgi:hypothetical protein
MRFSQTKTINSQIILLQSLSKGRFEYPYQLVKAFDPNGDGWYGVKNYDPSPMAIAPDMLLVGPPPSDLSAVVLHPGQWIELKFSGK